MDKFCLVAIMLFAIQRDIVDWPITDVINEIDRERDILSRADLLELEFADAIMSQKKYSEKYIEKNKRELMKRYLYYIIVCKTNKDVI